LLDVAVTLSGRGAAAGPPRSPRVIALVGIDGSGKTTQAHRLAATLTAQGTPATYWQNAAGRRWFAGSGGWPAGWACRMRGGCSAAKACSPSSPRCAGSRSSERSCAAG
jgi:hypothetical protein